MSALPHKARVGHAASAEDRLRSILAEAEAGLATMAPRDHIEISSPVCFIDEVSGVYAGHLSERELAQELGALAADLHRALLVVLLAPTEPGPIPDSATGLARALILTERLAASQHIVLSRPTDHGTPVPGQWPLIQAAILGRLRSVIPRVPDRMRDALSAIVTLVDGESKAVRTGQEAPPGRYSTGSHAASDR